MAGGSFSGWCKVARCAGLYLKLDHHHRGPNDAKATLLTNGLWLGVKLWTTVKNVFPCLSVLQSTSTSARPVKTSRTGPSSKISRVCCTVASYERTTTTATTSASLHTWKSYTGSLPRVHQHVGSVIEFGFFVGTTSSTEPLLFCAIATKLQRSCFAWVSCVDGGAGYTRRPCSRLRMLRLHRATNTTVATHKETVKGSDVDLKKIEVHSQDWLATGEHGVLQFVADSGLGYPRAHLRPDCPGFGQGHPRTKTPWNALHRNVFRAEVSTSSQSNAACAAN